MKEFTPFVIFHLAGQRYALPLETVERIVRAVEVTPLPNAPEVVLGLIDLEGRVLPVFDLRRRLRLPARAVWPGDQFIIAQTVRRAVVLVVDGVDEVIQHPQAGVVGAAQLTVESQQIQGVVKLGDGLVLIHDLESFLSPAEAQALDEAMEQKGAHVS